MGTTYWVNKLASYIVLFAVAYLGGRLVERWGVRVNYTRKLNHFALVFIPLFIDQVFHYHRTPFSLAVSLVLAIGTLALYVRPVRRRNEIVLTMFRSFDRPEDRPYTMLWLTTQVIVAALVLVPMVYLFARYGMERLAFLPILVVGIGDGLAEPVGVRFGRYEYECYALFTDRKYVRTLEGSLCVFLATLGSILLFGEQFSTPEFLLALSVLPPLMTVTEAYSPHTWDSPTLYFAGGVALFLIKLI